MSIRLYSYWRSSAAYRVRIALNLKNLPFETVPVSLAPGVSEHRADAYRAINPQMLVPFLHDGELGIAQSMAILEYLEETYPKTSLLPRTEPLRSRVRAFADHIACDIHPLNNLRIQTYIKEQLGADSAAAQDWYVHWVHEGFTALEALVRRWRFRIRRQSNARRRTAGSTDVQRAAIRRTRRIVSQAGANR